MHYYSVGCENHLQFEYAQEALRAYDDDDDVEEMMKMTSKMIMLLMILICITMKLNMLSLT